MNRFLQVGRRMGARPVLVIDDDTAWCEQVCRFLEPRGFHVIATSTKAGALERLAESDVPSAILADPATADPTFCRMLKALPELDSVPLFLVSASPARAVYEKGVGLSGYVRKSVALDHLMLLLGDAAATPHSSGGASHGRAA